VKDPNLVVYRGRVMTDAQCALARYAAPGYDHITSEPYQADQHADLPSVETSPLPPLRGGRLL